MCRARLIVASNADVTAKDVLLTHTDHKGDNVRVPGTRRCCISKPPTTQTKTIRVPPVDITKYQ